MQGWALHPSGTIHCVDPRTPYQATSHRTSDPCLLNKFYRPSAYVPRLQTVSASVIQVNVYGLSVTLRVTPDYSFMVVLLSCAKRLTVDGYRNELRNRNPLTNTCKSVNGNSKYYPVAEKSQEQPVDKPSSFCFKLLQFYAFWI